MSIGRIHPWIWQLSKQRWENKAYFDFDVFAIYSTKEKAVADSVVSSWENEGIRCWYALRDIEPGTDLLNQKLP